MDISKEELSARLEGSTGTAAPGSVPDGVDPGVLAAVIVGVLLAIALMFSMALLMDRRRTRFKFGANQRSSNLGSSSTTITIVDEMSPEPMSDPPAAETAGATEAVQGTCKDL